MRAPPPHGAVDIEPHFVVLRSLRDIREILTNIRTEEIQSRHSWFSVDERGIGRPPDISEQSSSIRSSRVASTQLPNEGDDVRIVDGSPRRPMMPSSESMLSLSSPLHPRKRDTTISMNTKDNTINKNNKNNNNITNKRGSSQRMLCVWDIDDTLVASGSSGVRQNPIFRDGELMSLFKSAGEARHLFLTQGSVDDVFAAGGRLRCVERYFNPQKKAEEAAEERRSTSNGFSFSDLFNCNGTKERESPRAAAAHACTFEKGTHVIRLASVRGSGERSDESDFLFDASAKPIDMDENGREVRWLVLRPSTYGISLGSLNAPIYPSAHTALVNGRQFHKMDVVWSLAASGHWDTVFFIDNNLSELGVVKYGMQMTDVLHLHPIHRIYRFFQSEFLLLAASAKLNHLRKEHGRDVTKPLSSTPCTELAPSSCGREKQSPPVAPVKGREPFGSESTDNIRDKIVVTENSTASMSNGTKILETSCSTLGNSSSSGSPSGANSAERHVKEVNLVLGHFHMPAEEYRQLLVSSKLTLNSGGGRRNKFSDSVGQPTFVGDSSLSDDQYEAVLSLFQHEESMLYQLMDEDMRTLGYVDVGRQSQWLPDTRCVHVPLYRRPTAVPHMRQLYVETMNLIQDKIIAPLQRGGGRHDVSIIVRADTHALYHMLLRNFPLIDPGFVGHLAASLFALYVTEGDLTKSKADCIKREVKRIMEPATA